MTSPQPSSPPAPARHPRRWLILGVLCLSLLVLVVDNTILNLAIPKLMDTKGLGASTADVQWIIDAYALVFAGLLLTAGSLSDRHGRRLALIVGLALFGGASLLVLAVTEPWHLVAVRALMGVGGSLLMPSTLSILITVFDDEERRKAIAAWTSVAMVGVIAGPTFGGFLLQNYWWGSVFLINVPIAVLAIIAAVVLMPESRGPARRPDPVGALLSMVGMTALVWVVISAPREGWSGEVIAAAALAVLGLAAFAIWEARSAHPMLPLRMFRDRNFSGASFSIVLLSLSSGGLLLALTQHFQFVLDYEPMRAALALIPMAVVTAVFNGVGATLGQKISNRTLLVIGFLIIAVAFGVMSFIGPDDGYGAIITALMIMGVGSGLAGPPAYATLMGAVPPEHAGVGSAVNDTVQQVGMALSVAVLGSVLAASYTAGMPGSAPEAARESIAGAHAIVKATGDQNLLAAAKEAFTGAMSIGSLVAVVCSVLAAIVGLVLIRRGTPPAPMAAPGDEAAKASQPA
ncbi:MFS transporter [Bailinhaonella thermotolerans]|uniref:MFS transporter n=1 Tax=Bailinhaonella thermotolerans TaxID=1070861 RepID=A0A3A4A2M9_9ACTN|nr:MFS transporter [Bailinhaonella thermotolerans]RJL21720.1 MFS transporter [Bailinhaonella thermotolerans]